MYALHALSLGLNVVGEKTIASVSFDTEFINYRYMYVGTRTYPTDSSYYM